jgi:hypothetical protein
MRYRIEIFDEVKSNDLTLDSEVNLNNNELSLLIISNIDRFAGNIHAYVYDKAKKSKVSAAYYPMDIVTQIKSKRV